MKVNHVQGEKLAWPASRHVAPAAHTGYQKHRIASLHASHSCDTTAMRAYIRTSWPRRSHTTTFDGRSSGLGGSWMSQLNPRLQSLKQRENRGWDSNVTHRRVSQGNERERARELAAAPRTPVSDQQRRRRRRQATATATAAAARRAHQTTQDRSTRKTPRTRPKSIKAPPSRLHFQNRFLEPKPLHARH